MGLLDFMDPGKDERRRGREALASVRVPDKSELELQLEELVRQGELRPEDIPVILQGDSAYETIQTDPRLRGTQMDTLAQLGEIVNAGGLDARGRAGLEDALETQRTESRGAQQAIMANARARGIGGSDLETVDRMIAQQAAATRGNRAALDTAALAEQRRADALAQQAALAGGIRTQDFGEKAEVAKNVDAIARYNAANRQDVATRNTQARNVAQATNLGERQRIADANTGTRNQQQQYNRKLPLTMYQLQRQKAGDYAAGQDAEALAEQDRTNRLVNMVGTAATAFALSDEREKEGVRELDSEAILRDVNGYTYQYRDDPSGAQHSGVMAQELERSPLAHAVHETPEGVKMVDHGVTEEPGMVFGLLADLSKRLEELEGARRGR